MHAGDAHLLSLHFLQGGGRLAELLLEAEGVESVVAGHVVLPEDDLRSGEEGGAEGRGEEGVAARGGEEEGVPTCARRPSAMKMEMTSCQSTSGGSWV